MKVMLYIKGREEPRIVSMSEDELENILVSYTNKHEPRHILLDNACFCLDSVDYIAWSNEVPTEAPGSIRYVNT